MESGQEIRGMTFGRWTVLDTYEKTKKGEKKWLCRCSCGTERYVLERSLKSGGSLSCGCLRKEEARKAAAHDLTGKVFGDLTVVGRSDRQAGNRGLWWRCQCACGTVYDVLGSLLVTGRKTHCGCKSEKKYAYCDITGQRFGRLTALRPTKERDAKGYVLWKCRCDCGKEVDVPYNSLVYANQRSCGCRKKEHDQALRGYLTHIDGTSLEMLASQKVPVNNTTGVRGVYLIKGKYVAKLVFQKKAYYLGAYGTLEEAAEARKEAEGELFQATVEYHARWQERADADPEWAKANPIQIHVTKVNGNLKIAFLPVLDSYAQPQAISETEKMEGRNVRKEKRTQERYAAALSG